MFDSPEPMILVILGVILVVYGVRLIIESRHRREKQERRREIQRRRAALIEEARKLIVEGEQFQRDIAAVRRTGAPIPASFDAREADLTTRSNACCAELRSLEDTQ